MSPQLRAAALLALAALLPGCDATDPYKREGMWHPMGANATNFAMQVARPSDLLIGRGSAGSDGDTAAQAVDRLRQNKVKPLPTVTSTTVGSAGSSN